MKSILIAFSLILLFACNDDDHPAAVTNPELPAITEDGLNTAGFTIREMDGTTRNWVPYVKCGGFGTNPCAAVDFQYAKYEDKDRPTLMSFGLSKEIENNWSDLSVTVIEVDEAGDHSDGVVQFHFRWNGRLWQPRENDDFEPIDFEFIVTKLDFEELIASGTFSGRLYNHDDEYIDIENGRFDFSFDACVCMR